ncbi:MAG: hypothetical protein HQL52_00915 [Magnetococcales bacterium]|nr:hypothetical protein [Magnetococcales bacterium]
MERDEISELISRGLEADLNREEMRILYRLAAYDAEAQEEMGELVEMEEGLLDLGGLADLKSPSPQLSQRIESAIHQNAWQEKPNPLHRIWSWFNSPRGLSMQPLSFATGLASALLVLGLISPMLSQQPGIAPARMEAARLQIQDVQFVNAEPRLDWTNRFIVNPGDSTQVALNAGANKPVHLQFESFEPTGLQVKHHNPETKKDQVHTFTVDGITYASLSKPQSGDAVTIRNNGQAPVVVFTHSASPENESISLYTPIESANDTEKKGDRSARGI